MDRLLTFGRCFIRRRSAQLGRKVESLAEGKEGGLNGEEGRIVVAQLEVARKKKTPAKNWAQDGEKDWKCLEWEFIGG